MSSLHPLRPDVPPLGSVTPLYSERSIPPVEAAAPSTAAERFDPLSDLMVAQRERPAHLLSLNLRALTPFQRSLMVIDGTVTKFIEAYMMEPVEVVRIAQESLRLAADHPWLDVPQGTLVIARQVMLQGSHNHTLYAYAVSLLVYDRLPEGVKEDLEVNPGGLGRVLLDHHLETRREILWYGREHIRNLPDPVGRLTDGRFISRTYRIIAKDRPLMLINEKFPRGMDHVLSHH